MSRVESFDMRIVELYLFIDFDRVEVHDTIFVQMVMDVPSLSSRLFGSLVPKSSSMISVGMRD